MNMRTVLRITLLVLSAAGIGVMGYLVSLHYTPSESAFCNLGEGLSCDIVNTSIYSEVFGIPVAILGLLYFLAVFAMAAWRYTNDMLRYTVLATIAFLGPSFYLTGIEAFVLNNFCIFCEISKALMVAIAGVALAASWKARPSWKMLAGALIAAAVLAGVSYYAHATIIPEGKYTAFAQCLDQEGFIMYGSEGCSFCAKQREMFGDAFEYINEIECDPRFPGAEVERCVARDIKKTPTWIQEMGTGEVAYRFDAGVQSLERLSEVSGCPLPDD